MTLRDDFLPVLDWGRGLLDDFGLRLFTVVCRVVRWSGERVGVGYPTYTDTTLTVDGSKRVKVRDLSSEEAIAQGGLYTNEILEIGPFTPTFSTGGTDPSDLNPSVNASYPQEVFYKVTGPGIEGHWYEVLEVNTTKPFRYMVRVRKSARTLDFFEPTDISSCKWWLRADMDYSSGTWSDQAGSNDAVQATEADRPTLTTEDAAYNNRATLEFGSTKHLSVAQPWGTTYTQPYTLVVVGNVLNASGQRYLLASSATYRIDVLNDTTAKATVGTYASPSSLTGSSALTSKSVVLITCNGASSAIYVNGFTAQATGTLGAATLGGSVLTIGGAASGASNSGGKIAEIIAFNAALTEGERTQVLNYCAARYGITLSA